MLMVARKPRRPANSPTSAEIVAARGYRPIYRRNQINHCPGCGRTAWIIGRSMAQCHSCDTALPLERN